MPISQITFHLLKIAVIFLLLSTLCSCNCNRNPDDDYVTTFSRLKSSAMDSTNISDWFYHSDSVRNMIEHYSSSGSSKASIALMYMALDCEKAGDAPAAIIFYDRAISLLQDDVAETYGSMMMRRLAYLQWRLCNRGMALRLYRQAITLDSITNDSGSLAEDYHSMSSIYRELGFLDKAHEFYIKSMAHTSTLGDEDMAIIKLNGLLIDAFSGTDIDVSTIEQTLTILRKSEAPNIRASSAVAGSLIYRSIGDDVSMSLWQSRAYEEMPLSDMAVIVPALSGQRYATATNKSTDIRTTLYNYQLHELQAQRLQVSTRQMFIWGLCGLSLLMAGVIVLLIKLNMKNRTCIRLQQLIADMDRLGSENTINHNNPSAPAYDATDPESLRNTLKNRMLSILETNKGDYTSVSLPEHVTSEINELLANNSPCVESSTLWHDIERAVLTQSPEFNNNLRLLIGRPVKSDEYRMMLLIKAGYRPSQLTCLLSRTKGTISNRRRMLCINIFGQNLGNDKFDKIIQLL